MSRLRLRKGLTVNAVSLMVGTIVTNALGFGFWALAAHLEPPAVVGRAAATIAALALLATIAQLNLTNTFVRLLPVAGRVTTAFVKRGYAAVLAVAVVLALVYAGSGLSASAVGSSSLLLLWFPAAVAVLAVFTLQDSVLTGLRLAPWVPVENVGSGACRLALLAILTGLSVPGGLVIAWVAPAAVAVCVVSWALLRRALPRLRDVHARLPGRRRLMSFLAGEYVGGLFATATLQLVPLLVVWRLGARELAYFTLPWLILTGITLLMWNVSFSFAVELLGSHGTTQSLLKRTGLLWGAIVLGVLVVCVLGARPLLGLAGASYGAHGAELLRLIGLSTPFTAIVTFYATLAWLDQRVWLLAGFQAIAGGLLVLGSLLLLPRVGLPGPGWANLGVQALAAAVLGPLAARRFRGMTLLEAR